MCNRSIHKHERGRDGERIFNHGQPNLPDWPIGLYMTYGGCDVNEASHTMFSTWVNTMYGGGCCGITWRLQATASQCAGIGLSSPCGDWAIVSELTKSYWSSSTDTVRRKFLLHEWAHQWNLRDYCGSHSALSKNGTASCPWPASVAYYDLDDYTLYVSYGR